MTRTFKRICIYCGSSSGHDPRFAAAARTVGEHLARNGLGLVYGGGRRGLMGELAGAALRAGGQVFGVIPQKLCDIELAHEGLTELFVVDSMHARKTMMAHLADAFVALPGGWGTLEEIFEVTTWSMLNYHRKPAGLLNVHGFFDHLLAYLGHASEQGFIRPQHRPLLVDAPDIGALLDLLARAEIPDFGPAHAPPPP